MLYQYYQKKIQISFICLLTIILSRSLISWNTGPTIKQATVILPLVVSHYRKITKSKFNFNHHSAQQENVSERSHNLVFKHFLVFLTHSPEDFGYKGKKEPTQWSSSRIPSKTDFLVIIMSGEWLSEGHSICLHIPREV